MSSNNATPLHSRLHPCSGWGGDHVGRAVGPGALRRAGWHMAAHVRLLSMGPGRPVPSTARCSAGAARSRPWWCPEAVRDVSPGTSPGCADRRCWGGGSGARSREASACHRIDVPDTSTMRSTTARSIGRPTEPERASRATCTGTTVAYRIRHVSRTRSPKPDRRRRRTCRTGRGRPESRPADERHRGRDITQPPPGGGPGRVGPGNRRLVTITCHRPYGCRCLDPAARAQGTRGSPSTRRPGTPRAHQARLLHLARTPPGMLVACAALARSLTCTSRGGGTPRLLAGSSTEPWPPP